jgi:pilus assembly protein Flp/PilA
MRQWQSLWVRADAWHRFVADERGATAVEYGLFAALIGLAIMGTISSTGQAIKTELYEQIGNTLASMTR